MEIIFTQAELNPILERFVPKTPQLFFTGTDSFDIEVGIKFGFRKTISCRIDHFSEQSITISYELNAIFNQLAKLINKKLPKGIVWDKANQKIHIDPFIAMGKITKNLPLDLRIKDFTIKNERLHIELTMQPFNSPQG